MNRRDIEAIYPLTEMQQGFLVRHLRDPERDDGFLEVRARLAGRLDVERLSAAWSRVVARHEALRSTVHWPAGKDAVRIVHASVPVSPLAPAAPGAAPSAAGIGHSSGSGPDQSRFLDRFALNRPPSWRLSLYREDEDSHVLLWVCHHGLVDGWSAGIVLDDLVEAYNRDPAGGSAEPPRPPAYSAYVRWLKGRDQRADQAYWRNRFDGFVPTLLARPQAAAGTREPVVTQGALEPDLTRRLVEVGRLAGLPLGSLVQAAWALALAAVSGSRDIGFGLTVSGRPAELPGIGAMAGMFMNALPLRVRLDPGDALISWLQSVQAETLRAMEHGYAGPATLQHWTQISGSLFDSLIVFENYRPTSDRNVVPAHPDTLRLLGFQSGLAVGVPVTLGVLPGERLRFEIRTEPARIPEPVASALTEAFRTCLSALASGPSGSVDALLAQLPAIAPSPSSPAAAPPRATPAEEGAAEMAPALDAPTTPLELRLALLVAEILSATLPGLDDDFFSLGGDSMSALRLLGRIDEAFGRAPSVEAFLARPTVRGLTAALEEAAVPSDSGLGNAAAPSQCLIPLSSGGDGRPLFLVHAGGGHVLFYHELARRLGIERPVYALQAAGLDGREPPLRSVESMADRYLSEIRARQPRGPYALAGLCFGDLVALEMARRLRAHGETVDPLIMLDSAPYHLAETPVPRMRLLGPVGGLLVRVIRGEWSYLAARLRTLRKGQWTRKVPLPVLDATNPRMRALSGVLESIRAAEEAYRPAPYDGSVLLVRTTELARRADKTFHEKIWRTLARGGLSVETIDAGHVTMFERAEETDRLAAALRRALHAAERGREG